MRLLTRLLCAAVLTTTLAYAQWGNVETSEFKIRSTKLGVSGFMLSALPGVTPAFNRHGVLVVVDVKDQSLVADAVEVTLRYRDGTGKVWEQRQIRKIYNHPHGKYTFAQFYVGIVTPISTTARTVRWESAEIAE